MLKINKKNAKGRWYKLPTDKTVELFIIPFPFTKGIFSYVSDFSEDGINKLVENKLFQSKMMFVESLLDWKGVVGEDNKPLKCIRANKELVFDNSIDIVQFVLEVANDDKSKIVREIKNL